jgi:hypothetical protein
MASEGVGSHSLAGCFLQLVVVHDLSCACLIFIAGTMDDSRMARVPSECIIFSTDFGLMLLFFEFLLWSALRATAGLMSFVVNFITEREILHSSLPDFTFASFSSGKNS